MFRRTLLICVAATSLLISGCNPYKEVAPVSGKVTFKGQPLAGVTVVLTPVGGRPSYGRTDAEGNYEMRYTIKQWGAKVGTCNVAFDPTSSEPTGDPTLCDPSPLIKDVPAKYFRNIVDFQVEQKKNTLDINVE